MLFVQPPNIVMVDIQLGKGRQEMYTNNGGEICYEVLVWKIEEL
jgi:hypothetical protein